MGENPMTEFEKAASARGSDSILRELWEFQRHNRKWWMLPMLLIFLLVSLISVLGGTGAAPFIYTLF